MGSDGMVEVKGGGGSRKEMRKLSYFYKTADTFEDCTDFSYVIFPCIDINSCDVRKQMSAPLCGCFFFCLLVVVFWGFFKNARAVNY